MNSSPSKTAWQFDPARYPRSYETRIESYPLRRKAGFVLTAIGLVGLVGGLLHGTPYLALSGCALLLISFWLLAVRLQTITLYPDRIEIRNGKVVEVRHRDALLGWKYAMESRDGEQSGKPCWVLLVPTDDDLTPLMVQSNRPELDKEFYSWLYTLPDLMTSPNPAPSVLTPLGGHADLKK